MSSNAYTVNIVNAEELYVAGDKISGFRLGAVKERDSNIGLNTDFPKLQLDISGTGAIRIPAGTTADRSSIKNSLISGSSTAGIATDLLGVLRYNKTTSRYEAIYEHTLPINNNEPKWGNFVMEDSSGNVYISDNLTVGGIIIGDLSGNATTVTNGVYTTGDQIITGIKDFTKNGAGEIAKFSRKDAMELVIDGDNGNCNFLVKSTTGINIAVDSSLPQYNSTKGIFIKNDGNVGIGTTTPRCRLDVSGVGMFKSPGGFNGLIVESDTRAVGINHNHIGMEDTSHDFYIQYPGTGNTILNYDGGNVGIGKDNPSYRLDVSGNGCFNDGLEVTHVANDNNRKYLHFGKFPNVVSNIPYIQGSGTGTGYNMALNPYNGNVGIGTNNPGAKLEVFNGNINIKSGGPQVELISQDGKDGWTLNANVSDTFRSGRFRIISKDNNSYPSGAEKFTILRNGNVGIGTSSPSMRLTVKAQNREISIGDTGSNNVGQIICHETGNSSNVSYLRIRAYGIQCYTYSNNRYIDIEKGDEINSSNHLYLQYSNNRNIYLCSGGGDVFVNRSIQITSDDRLKHNEIVIDNALETINKLTAKKYFKTQEMYEPDKNFDFDAFGNLIDDDGNKLKYRIETGFIAQEVQKISELKYLVKNCDEGKDIFEDKKDENGNIIYEKDGSGNNTEIPEQVSVGKKKMPLTLNYQDIFVLNVQATQEIDRELQADKLRIAASEAKIAALEAENTALKARLDAIEAKLILLEKV
jgi:hypothetical protein